MNTLGERLRYVRKRNGYTQDSLAETIGVSRGVIFNLEKNKVEPQAIVINAICQTLSINKDWLIKGIGGMKGDDTGSQVLSDLYEVARDLSEDEQLYLLDTIKALKQRLNKEQECKSSLPRRTSGYRYPLTDKEIEKEVEDYRRELIEEKRAKEKLSASQDLKEG